MPEADLPANKPKRLLSLDAFRGFDIALMILVNMTWDRDRLPSQLFHVGWNAGEQGVTITDLVFPWFLFIVGVAIPFSMAFGRGAQHTKTQRILLAFRRGLVIYTLGLILDAATYSSFAFLRWNILQLIGAAYFLAVCLAQLPRLVQIAFCVAVLATKWYILSIYAHPDHGQSVWYFAVDGEVVDNRYAPGAVPVNGEQVFKSRMLSLVAADSFLRPVMNWATNIFNLLPATVVVVLGSFIGRVLLKDTDHSPKTAYRLIGIGVGAWFLSYLWNLHHPWSKDFFTASYAVLAAGTGTALLGLFDLLIDADRPFKFPKPVARFGDATRFIFVVFGVNAIALYFGNEFVFKAIATKWSLGWTGETPMINAYYAWIRNALGPVAGAYAFAISWLTLWWLFCYCLWRRRLFIKV